MATERSDRQQAAAEEGSPVQDEARASPASAGTAGDSGREADAGSQDDGGGEQGAVDDSGGGAAADAGADERVSELEQRLQEQEELAGERLDALKRLKADFENYRRRMTREQARWRRQAVADFVAGLLPVRDNLLRALEAADNADDTTCTAEGEGPSGAAGDGAGGGQEAASDPEGLRQGVEMTLKQLDQVLADAGIEAVEPAGEPFDPRFHEAMLQEETQEQPHNTVLEVFQTGFRLADQVIRPAMVKIAKNPAGVQGGSGEAPEGAADTDSEERKEA